MNDNKFTPKCIDNQLFSIPLYQRLYAWTPKEVKKLLSDLKEHFESDRFKKEQNPYYLGMLTAIEQGGYTVLIDGQQRFTVMILMAIAFKDIPEWKSFLKEGKRLVLKARSEDENYLKKLANEDNLAEYLNSGRASCEYENPYMKDTLIFINNYLNTEFTEEHAVKAFAINIYNHLTFFISMLPPHYLKDATSLNKYFEVLNSTGKGLEQHEILKVKLIRNQPDSDRLIRIWNAISQMDQPTIHRKEDYNDTEYANLYKSAIDACRKGNYENALSYIETHVNDADEEAKTIDIIPVKKKDLTSKSVAVEREDSIISFPEFLLLSLDLFCGINGKDGFYQKDKLIDRFEKHTVEDIHGFYNQLLFYRLLLDYYVVRRDFSNGQSKFKIIFRDSNDEKKEERERLKQYISMLSVSTEFHIWLVPYMKQLCQLQDDWQSASSILQKLKQEDDMRRCVNGYPGKLRTEQYPNIDRYWFWRLDYYLWERRNDEDLFDAEDRKVVAEFVFRTNRSIEHLHPQDESNNEEWKDSDITNGFGNLAMISQSFNSLQSNDNIRLKFARIQEQLDNNSLQSIKMLVMYRSANRDHSKWSKELAQENLDKMCRLLEETVSYRPEIAQTQ